MPEFSVLIPYRSSDPTREAIFNWIKSRWELLYQDFDVEILYGSNDDEVFSRSKSRNELAKKALSDILVFADADTIPVKDFVDRAVSKTENGLWCIAYGDNDYYNLTREATETILSFDPGIDVDRPNNADFEFRVMSWAGMFSVSKQDFFSIGGYDERFVGWGHEDVAFRLKADYFISKHLRVKDGFALHLWHPRDDSSFGTEDELRNRKLFESQYRRVFGWKDERLK